MPLMPMPPMPTKCTGPMSRGSFMEFTPLTLSALSSALSRARRKKSNPRHRQHQFRQPLGGIDGSGGFCALRHAGKTLRVVGQRADFGGKTFRGEIALLEQNRAPGLCQHAGIGALVLIERMRQRHQNGGPADRR